MTVPLVPPGGGPQHERGIVAGRASAVTCTSPSRSTTPGAEVLVLPSTAGSSAPRSTEAMRRHVSSLVHAMVRAAPEIDRMAASASAKPRRVGDGVLLLERGGRRRAGRCGGAARPGRRAASVGLAERLGVALEEQDLGLLGPAEGVDVAQAAAALLEVGLEQEGHLAGAVVAVLHRSGQLRRGAASPASATDPGARGSSALRAVSPAMWRTDEERRGGVEVVLGEAEGLLDGADGVAELQALVPDRVPEPLGDPGDVGSPVVQQQHVDVGERGELAPARSHPRRRGRRRGRRGSRRPDRRG